MLLRLILTTALVLIIAGTTSTIGSTANSTNDRWLVNAFICIHHYEGAWNANTGNGYYGGLQMDWAFMHTYGPWYLRRFGTADKWKPIVQIRVAIKAYKSGRGFSPWPNTRRLCGL